MQVFPLSDVKAYMGHADIATTIALIGRPDAAPFLEGVIDDWVEPVGELLIRLDFEPGRAASEARLAIAVARGLLLDLLATGERAAIDRATQCFLDRYRPGPA